MDLTKGNVVGNIWALALPMILGNILQTAFNLVDMFWVGRLGPEAIASVAMSGVVLLVIMTLVIGIAAGTLAMVARCSGAKDQAGAENVAMQSLIVGGVLSIILAVVGLILARPILQVLGAKGRVLGLGTNYLKIILAGGLVMVYLFLANSILRAAADAFTPMLIMLGATILNIILDPLMIFGIGFPRMGVSGAALATVISRGLASLAGLYILFRGHSRIRLHLRKLRLDLKVAVKIIKVGFPNSIQMALRSIVGLVLMAIVARYGSYAIAAYGIGLRIFSVVLMLGFALANSAATLVGQNLGAKRLMRAEQSAWSCARFNGLLMGLSSALFFIFSAKLISIFSNNPCIIKLGSEYLKVTSFSYVFVAIGMVLGYSLIGAGDTVTPLFISVFTLLGIQIPLAIVLPTHFHIGISGVWWAILTSSVLHSCLTAFWFNLGRWKLKRI